MDLRGLAFIGCRLLALFCVAGLLAKLPETVAAILSPPGLTAWAIPSLLHGGIVLRALLALMLWFAAQPLSTLIAGHGIPARTMPRKSGEDLPRAVFAAAGVLVLALAIDDLLQLALLSHGFIAHATDAARRYAAAGHGLAAAVKISLSLWLLLGARGLRPVMAKAADSEAGLVQLLNGLARTIRSEAGGVVRQVMRSSLDAVIAAVEQRKLDFGAIAADGTVTIVFSDMEGFTAMTQRLGDRAAHKVIKAHNRIVREAVQLHAGQEVELQGDGFLLAFADVAQALRCACVIQRDCGAYSAKHPKQPIRVRIGLHTGKPIKEGDRFFGITVILAARIAAQAQGGETLVSSAAHEQLAACGEFAFELPREAELKGLDGTHRMYAVRGNGLKP
ncbi:MAG: adenylate/guanylate cyclase domain-containing protein [Stenotrophobium sp.]